MVPPEIIRIIIQFMPSDPGFYWSMYGISKKTSEILHEEADKYVNTFRFGRNIISYLPNYKRHGLCIELNCSTYYYNGELYTKN